MKYDKDSDSRWLAVTGILKGYTNGERLEDGEHFQRSEFTWESMSLHLIYFIVDQILMEYFLKNIWTKPSSRSIRMMLAEKKEETFYPIHSTILVECLLRNPKLDRRNVWTKLNEFMWIFLVGFVGIFFERSQSCSLISKVRILAADLITRIVRETIADEAFSGS